MEYDFYLEQKYLHEGRVEARILTAAQAEAMGYEDGYIRSDVDHKLYVDGFDNTDAIHNYWGEPDIPQHLCLTLPSFIRDHLDALFPIQLVHKLNLSTLPAV